MSRRPLPSSDVVLQCFPFVDEKLETICDTSDLLEFLDWHTLYFCNEQVAEFLTYVHDTALLKLGQQISRGATNELEMTVVGALKHSFAYRQIVDGLVGLDELNIGGLPYLVEACTDIECSLLLLSKGHHKQSVQLLRSALEAVVTHAYFSTAGVTYDDLPNQRTPPMNNDGRGMLNHLEAIGLLSEIDAKEISTLYGELSAATHSQYKYLSVKFEVVSKVVVFAQSIRHLRDVCITCMSVILNMDRMDIH